MRTIGKSLHATKLSSHYSIYQCPKKFQKYNQTSPKVIKKHAEDSINEATQEGK